MKLKCLICLFLFCALFFTGCRDDRKVDVPVIELVKNSDFTEYPDSSFFKDITCMSVDDGKLYMFEDSRGDVAMWDKKNNRFLVLGSLGPGPKEVGRPKTFFAQNGKVSIMDGASRALKIYDEQGGVESVQLPCVSALRFFVEKGTTYVSCAYKETSYVKVPESWKLANREAGLLFCGSFLDISENKGINISRNNRHLVKGDGCLYAICPSFPLVEKYDLDTNELLSSFDLSAVDIIRKNLEYIASQNHGPTTYSVYLRDVYFCDGKLYILCATWNNKFQVNKLLVLDEELSPLGIYKLPGNMYTSFCVDDKFIYAMNYGRCAVEMFEVPSSF